MEFEFDLEKSIHNKNKHSIDFYETQILWQDPDRIEIPAKDLDEARYLLIATFNDKVWSAIYTYRKDKIRIISVRRSKKNEKEIYES